MMLNGIKSQDSIDNEISKFTFSSELIVNRIGEQMELSERWHATAAGEEKGDILQVKGSQLLE